MKSLNDFWEYKSKFGTNASNSLGLRYIFTLIIIFTKDPRLKTFCYAAGLPGALLAFVFPDIGININITQPWYFIAFTAFMIMIITLMMLPFTRQKANDTSHQYI